MKKSKAELTEHIVFYIALISMTAALAYSIVRFFMTPTGDLEAGVLTRNDYVMMAGKGLGGILLLFLPMGIEKRWKIDIPAVLNILLIIFVYASIFLGEFRDFYFTVPHWDKILHFISGIYLGLLSFSVISVLNGHDIIKMNPFFVAIFTFCFAMTIGVLWEMYEYIGDYFSDLNMQRYADPSGVPFVGHEALYDTMGDLIIDSLGALIISILGYFAVKNKSSSLRHVLIKKRDEKNTIEKTVETL